MPRPRAAVLVVSVLCAFAVATAEPPARRTPRELLPWASFDPKVPSPARVLGFETGDRPARHEEVLRYVDALVQASPRAKRIDYGLTHEGRPLVALAIADEGTIAGLEAFRLAHARRLDPRGRAREKDAAALADAKAVAWMAYGIHGDEVSSTDAALVLAYWLAAGEDDRAKAIRRNLVVLVDVCENPDGRDRFLAQLRAFGHKTPNADLEDLSHTAIWPWGRGNHYLFDLNRDWFTQIQPESGRAGAVAAWNPQLVVDSHEMGSDDSYLFSPARHPFNPFLPSGSVAEARRYAADQAKALDGRGYAYYTREWNEEFFPGYGSSWAEYQGGATGILYEMSGTDGTRVKQRTGLVRTFAQAVEHQLVSSVANLETLAGRRDEALRETLDARREAIRRGEAGTVRAWIVGPGLNPDASAAAGWVASRQGIESYLLAAPATIAGLRDIRTGASVTKELPAGTRMFPADQPAGNLLRVIFDPHVPMSAPFLREEREYLEKGKGSRLYDTTAWSLPLMIDAEAYWTATKPAGDWKREEPAPAGPPSVEAATYGWIAAGASDRALVALRRLFEDGISVRLAEKAFRVEGRTWERGAILVKREGNPDDLRERLQQVASATGVAFVAVGTALAEDGPDLGGSHFHPLVAPRVGVWTGPSIEPSSYGAIWHLFDEGLGLRFTALDLSRFQGVDLDRYNVLVFPPETWSGSYATILGKGGIDRIKRWAEGGGTLIGLGEGASFLAAKESGLTKTRMRSEALDRFPPAVWGITAAEAIAAGPTRAAGIFPEPPKAEEKATAKRESPYDVAPVLGDGAKPFATGVTLGSPVTGQPVPLGEWLKPVLPAGQTAPKDDDLKSADERLRRFSPSGAFLRIDLDPEVWMTWGMGAETTAWMGADDTLVAEPPVEVPARFSAIERLHLGGLLWPEAAGRIAMTAYATRERLGRGQAILFLDHPARRGWMRGTQRLFANAVMFGPGMGTAPSAPW